MKVGVDGRKLPGAETRDAIASLEFAADLGMEGVFFRTVLDVSPDLDGAFLRALRRRADELDLYLEIGLANVNPFAVAESPNVRVLGDGDYRRGIIRMMEACADIGCLELWVGTANYKIGLPGYFVFDRFRTDTTWPDQLHATEKFLSTLAPRAVELGCHLNIETHEEITSFEVVRLVEAVGSDAIGVTFDTANVIARGEDPVSAAQRVAPYVRMSHVRDVALAFTDYGIGRMLAPVGEGVFDWPAILTTLRDANPDLNLSIENSRDRSVMPMHVYDQQWLRSHPDLTEDELGRVIQMTRDYESRAAQGELSTTDFLLAHPCDEEEKLRFIEVSASRLREMLAQGTAALVD